MHFTCDTKAKVGWVTEMGWVKPFFKNKNENILRLMLMLQAQAPSASLRKGRVLERKEDIFIFPCVLHVTEDIVSFSNMAYPCVFLQTIGFRDFPSQEEHCKQCQQHKSQARSNDHHQVGVVDHFHLSQSSIMPKNLRYSSHRENH